MSLSKIAFKNLKHNFSFYALYLCSVSFVLMIFFCFISFAKNEVIMESISTDGRVETMCKAVSLLIMAFVIFYMSYSNRFFMQRRMNELGIYSLLGYNKKQMIKLLTIENVLVCSGGMAAGILTGGILHRAIITAIKFVLKLDVDFSEVPLFNMNAVIFSLLFVGAVLLALFFSNIRILYKNTLLDLVRMEKRTEKPIKIRITFALAGALLLIIGYLMAADMTKGKSSIWHTIGFSPVALMTLVCVVSGTILFIYSFLPFLCRILKKRKKSFYNHSTIIVLPKFQHRIRSNAKSIILLILLCAGTLSVLGSTLLSVWYPVAALERIIPSAMEFRAEDGDTIMKAARKLDESVGSGNYIMKETDIIKVTADGKKIPSEYFLGEDKGRSAGFECISISDYHQLLNMQGKENDMPKLLDSECVLIKYQPDNEETDLGSKYFLDIGGARREVTVKAASIKNPVGFGNSVGTLVVSDHLYKEMKEAGLPTVKIISVDGPGMRTNQEAYKSMRSIMHGNPYFVSACQRRAELLHENSSTLLLIFFATVIFLIATGSVLYFQNLSAVVYDRNDYEILKKMGYSKDKIKKLICRQIQIYFIIPYILGTVHSIFALICYKSALMDDILGKTSVVLIPIGCSVLIFLVVYLFYYLITKRSCYKCILM